MNWLTLLIIAVLFILVIKRVLPNHVVPSGLMSLPGPTGLPLLGYLPFLGRFPYVKFTELSKKYGPIFQLRLGQKTVIVLNNRDVIQEAFVRDNKLSGRPFMPIIQAFLDVGPGGFTWLSGGNKWKLLRKNSIKALSLFASSRNSRLEALVESASESMNAKFAESSGKPFDPVKPVDDCVAAIIGSINFGGQFDSNNILLDKLKKMLEFLSDAIQKANTTDLLPFRSLFIQTQAKQKVIAACQHFFDAIISHVDNHKCNSEVADAADALDKVAKEADENELEAMGVKKSEEIRYIAQDLFIGGFSTTMDTFIWCLNILAVEQGAQAKLSEELNRVLQGRKPSLNDRNQLPYTEATLLEVLRFSSLLPVLLPHAAMEDTELCGYYIPKGATVLANAYGVHYDETVFKSPFKFEPERFLSIDSRSVDSTMAQAILPFGAGKRRCVGENLARQELFLLLGSVFQRFQVEPAPGENIDINNCKTGILRDPIKHKLVFKLLE